MIITISREFGAAGGEVAKGLAQALGWTLVDNELIDEVAKRVGLPPEEVAEREERAPSFIERLTRTLASAMPEFVAPESGTLPDLAEERLAKVTDSAVSDLAGHENIVMVGRAAAAVLASRPGALHVKIVAPPADRITRISARFGVDAKEAEKRVNDSDGNRARYHKQYYQRDWNDASNYHMTVNTGKVGVERSVQLILSLVSSLRDQSGQ
jgi:cytidylate kinase